MICNDCKGSGTLRIPVPGSGDVSKDETLLFKSTPCNRCGGTGEISISGQEDMDNSSAKLELVGEVLNEVRSKGFAQIVLRFSGLRAGDRLLIFGAGGVPVEFTADEINIASAQVGKADLGAVVWIKVPGGIHPGSTLFRQKMSA